MLTCLAALREQVGLLAARGEFLYGFLHLTFQEYLAAIYLVRDPDNAAAEILRRVNQPRWREVIILALGEVGHSWPKSARDKLIVDLLLTEHSGQLAPHLGVSLRSINEADVMMREDGASPSNTNLALSPTKSSKSPKRCVHFVFNQPTNCFAEYSHSFGRRKSQRSHSVAMRSTDTSTRRRAPPH